MWLWPRASYSRSSAAEDKIITEEDNIREIETFGSFFLRGVVGIDREVRVV